MSKTRICSGCLQELPVDCFIGKADRCRRCQSGRKPWKPIKSYLPKPASYTYKGVYVNPVKDPVSKTCGECKIDKPIAEFGNLKKSADGLSYQCRDCRKQMHRQHNTAYRKITKQRSDQRKKRFWDQYTDGCCLCDETDIRCLDFHHLDPDTKDDMVSTLWGLKDDTRLLREIAKCAVVCANCHRKIHAGDSPTLKPVKLSA